MPPRFSLLLFLAWGMAVTSSPAAVPCTLEFAPQEGIVQAPERPFRDELCLNGLWQFQPVALPAGYKRNSGVPPELAQPRPDAWSSTPIKIPSHWNINTWGGGRREMRSADRLYWPDSVYFFPNGKPEGRNQGRYRTELLGIDPVWFDENGDLVSSGPSYTKQTVTW